MMIDFSYPFATRIEKSEEKSEEKYTNYSDLY